MGQALEVNEGACDVSRKESHPPKPRRVTERKRGARRLPKVTLLEKELENELAGELDVAASEERGRHESGVDFRLTARDEQVRVVEGVVGFKPQLYPLPLLDLEVLEQVWLAKQQALRTFGC